MAPKLQIAGLGLSTIDILIRLGSMPSWTNGGNMDELRLDGGGPVGTALVAASRLGARTGYIGTRGNDELGDLKLLYLSRDGVDTSRIVTRPFPETQLVVVYVQSDTGERVFSFADNFSSQDLLIPELDQAYLTSADFLHLDGYCHVEASIAAIDWMHAAGKQVVLDAGRTDGAISEKMVRLVEKTDYLICGSGFGASLTGKKDLFNAGEAILKLGPEVVVQTEGDKGSYTTSKDTRFHTPAFAVEVVDTTGAGDVFHGAYLVGLLKGWPLDKIAVFSSAVAALKCTRLGGRKGSPYLHEVLDFLKKHNIETTISGKISFM